jgi:hypothetical protein
MGSFLYVQVCDKTNVKSGADFGLAAFTGSSTQTLLPDCKGLIKRHFR